MDYRERGSHARGVYLTQDTSRMGTARVKQEQEADTRIIVWKMEERKVDTKGNSPKQDLTSAKDLTIELPEGRDSPHPVNMKSHLIFFYHWKTFGGGRKDLGAGAPMSDSLGAAEAPLAPLPKVPLAEAPRVLLTTTAAADLRLSWACLATRTCAINVNSRYHECQDIWTLNHNINT